MSPGQGSNDTRDMGVWLTDTWATAVYSSKANDRLTNTKISKLNVILRLCLDKRALCANTLCLTLLFDDIVVGLKTGKYWSRGQVLKGRNYII